MATAAQPVGASSAIQHQACGVAGEFATGCCTPRPAVFLSFSLPLPSSGAGMGRSAGVHQGLRANVCSAPTPYLSNALRSCVSKLVFLRFVGDLI